MAFVPPSPRYKCLNPTQYAPCKVHFLAGPGPKGLLYFLHSVADIDECIQVERLPAFTRGGWYCSYTSGSNAGWNLCVCVGGAERVSLRHRKQPPCCRQKARAPCFPQDLGSGWLGSPLGCALHPAAKRRQGRRTGLRSNRSHPRTHKRHASHMSSATCSGCATQRNLNEGTASMRWCSTG